jgi:hypothetical protein
MVGYQCVWQSPTHHGWGLLSARPITMAHHQGLGRRGDHLLLRQTCNWPRPTARQNHALNQLQKVRRVARHDERPPLSNMEISICLRSPIRPHSPIATRQRVCVARSCLLPLQSELWRRETLSNSLPTFSRRRRAHHRLPRRRDTSSMPLPQAASTSSTSSAKDTFQVAR